MQNCIDFPMHKCIIHPCQTKRHRVSRHRPVHRHSALTTSLLRFAQRQQAQPRSVTRGEAAEPRTTSCQTSGALRWAQQLTDTALIEISKAPASGAAGTRQRGYACKLSIGELPGQRKRYGARGTWVWRALNAINEAFAPLPSNRRRPERHQGIPKPCGSGLWHSTGERHGTPNALE